MDSRPPLKNDPLGQEPESPQTITRRKFLDTALWAGGVALVAAVVYPITRYLVPPPEAEPDPATVNAGKVEDFQPNTGTIFKMGRKPGILIRTQEGEFHAFIAMCTHLECTVQYRPDMGLIS
jgi:cytochrome b6-f complex iron-sulfur subunit